MRRLRCLLAGALCLVALSTAHAYDPSTTWLTLRAPHFRVHFPRGYYRQALDLARAAEHAYARLTKRLAWTPQTPIHVVLADEQDYAQGFAQNVPYDLIGLNAAPPGDAGELSEYRDWEYELVTHELTHIVHIDTVRGLPAAVNAILGKQLTPNGTQPRWLVEGTAIYFESALSAAGRNRSSYVDMVLRMATLDGAFMNLATISGSPLHWPQASAWYYFGGRFVDYLAHRYGPDSLRRLSYDQGGRLIPWAVNVSAHHALHRGYRALYADFRAAEEARYRRQEALIDAAGRIEGTLLTHQGQSIAPARVAANGTLYFVASPIDAHASLRAITPDGHEHRVGTAQQGGRLALLPDGVHAIMSRLDIVNTYDLYNDLVRVDLRNGSTERLTYGARADEPDVSADGRWLVFVQTQGDHSVLRLAPLAHLRAVRTLVDLGPATQVWTPRFSPDGAYVAFAGFRQEQRDLYRVRVADGCLQPLTHDAAYEGGPAYTADGAWLLFHSDRDGVFNLYAMPAAGGEPRRLTRVLGGAFHPEPTADGRAVIYRSYGPRGFNLARLALPDIATLPPEPVPTGAVGLAAAPPVDAVVGAPAAPPLDATAGAPAASPVDAIAGVATAGRSQRVAAPPAAVADVREPPRRSPIQRATTAVYPVQPYSPWSTLRPYAWLPLSSQDTQGTTLGIQVGGQDAVDHHEYLADLWWGLASQFPGFDVSYVNRSFFPGLGVEAARYLDFAPVPAVRNGTASSVQESVWQLRLGTSWPLFTRRDVALSLSTAYELAWRRAMRRERFAPTDTAPQFPDEGRFADLRLQLHLDTSQRYIDSISDAAGGRYDVTVRLEDPDLGSQYRALSATVSLEQYIANPWFPRQVLALRLGAGYGTSSYTHRALFSVSGLPQRDVLLDLITGYAASTIGLRGFSQASIAGDAIVTAGAEYRFPLWDVQWGFATLPFFFETLHAAAFVDAAAVANHPLQLLRPRAQHVSVGGELLLDFLVGYAVPATVRLGYGVGLGHDANQHALYVLIGGSY